MPRSSVFLLALLPVLTACGRLSAGGGGGVVTPPTVTSAVALHPTAALVSAVAGPGVVRVDWVLPDELPAGVTAGLFVGPDASTLFDEVPVPVAGSRGHVVLTGLADGVPLHLALGWTGVDGVTPVGTPLGVRPGPVTYVDVDNGLGDGSAPDAPTSDLVGAVFLAFALGGGNVWVASGEVAGAAIPLFGGVHLYGGFPPDFDLAQRDLAGRGTRLIGFPGETIVTTQTSAAAGVVLDGFVLDGRGASPNGVEVVSTAAELRSLVILNCQRGIKLRAPEAHPPLPVVVTGCSVLGCELEGLSGAGALDLCVEASRFDGNLQEGLDLDDLVAASDGLARLLVRGSSMSGNGAEGVDVDLAAPAAGGSTGGRFEVHIQDCAVDRNALAGLLLDVDYESSPAWSAQIVLRGCSARANGGAGFSLDLDQQADVVLHRLTASANRGDGVVVSSESASGMATLSACALFGNLGAGARATFGNFGVVASHCLFAGNAGGGMVGDTAPVAVVSGIAYLQDAAWVGARPRNSITVADAFAPTFVNAARIFAIATSVQGAAVGFGTAPGAAAGQELEAGDDGIARTIVSVGATTVIVDPAPGATSAPLPVAIFAPGAPVAEDFELTPGSAARGVAMSPPGGPTLDAGPFGSPVGGAPGIEDGLAIGWFAVSRSEPAWVGVLSGSDPLELGFLRGIPDAASLPGSVAAFDGAGASLAIDASVDAGRLIVSPPPAGWPAEAWVELYSTLRSVEGAPLVPIALPITSR